MWIIYARYCFKKLENMTVQSGVQVALRAEVEGKGHVKIKWEQHVKVDKESLTSLEGWIRRMLQIKDSVVVVINMGIWYNSHDEYVYALDRLTSLLLSLTRVWEHHPRAKYIAIVLAETTAQHFHTRNGYFNRKVYENTSRSAFCAPITNPIDDWRNDVLWSYVNGKWGHEITSLSHVLLDVLPMKALTQDLADIHLRQRRHDCTHYCYTPMLYQPIYSSLLNISERLLEMRRII
jgi:hypothetical protein